MHDLRFMSFIGISRSAVKRKTKLADSQISTRSARLEYNFADDKRHVCILAKKDLNLEVNCPHPTMPFFHLVFSHPLQADSCRSGTSFSAGHTRTIINCGGTRGIAIFPRVGQNFSQGDLESYVDVSSFARHRDDFTNPAGISDFRIPRGRFRISLKSTKPHDMHNKYIDDISFSVLELNLPPSLP